MHNLIIEIAKLYARITLLIYIFGAEVLELLRFIKLCFVIKTHQTP
jgi:hypothetical protein